MPDTALDTEAVPFRSVPAGDVAVNEPPPPDDQVAQAPPPSASPDRAVDPNATPVQPAAPTQPAAPGGLTFVERPEDEDRADAAAARQAELEVLKSNPREHQEPYRPLVAPNLIDPRDTQKWHDLEALRLHYPEMTPRDRREAESTIRFEQNRLITEINLKNKAAQAAYLQQQRADMAGLDNARATPEALAKTAAEVEQARQTLAAEKQTMAQSGATPDEKSVGDYSLKVSPLGTMKGPEFSDAVAQFARLNALTPRQAVQYGIILGSPVDRDQKTGALLPGKNTLPPNVLGGPDRPVIGRGATAYTIVGRDSHNNALVQMPDQKIIRVPLTTLAQFTAVREKGYDNQKKWWGNRRQSYIDAAKPDMLTRGAQWLYRQVQ
jgi:hypothetical protein